MAHHHHSHAADISAAERDRIAAFIAAHPSPHAEQLLGELAFFSAQNQSKTGEWTMGELDRFITDYLPGHVGDAALTAAAPDVIVGFAKWLKDNGVPRCDVAAVEKRMRKISKR